MFIGKVGKKGKRVREGKEREKMIESSIRRFTPQMVPTAGAGLS